MYSTDDEELAMDDGLQDGNPDIISITICGAVFVLDLQIEKHSAIVNKVSVSASQDISIDERANVFLTGLLQSFNLKDFEKALKLIAFCDKSSTIPQLDLFQCLVGMELDVALIHEKEINSTNDNNSLLKMGLGVPRFYKDNLGPSIAYFCFGSPSMATLQEDDEPPSTFIAKISIEACAKISKFLPKFKTQALFTKGSIQDIPPKEAEFLSFGGDIAILNPNGKFKGLEMYIPSDSSPLVTQGSFILELDPPVCLSFMTIEAIKCNNDVLVAGLDQMWNGGQGETYEGRFLSLKKNAMFYSGCKTKTPLFQGTKIQFSHVSNLYTIFKYLRQAIVFEKVICSILEAPDSAFLNKVHLTNWNPPQLLQFFFMSRKAPYRYGMDVVISENGALNVNVVGFENNVSQPIQPPTSSKEYQQALQNCDIISIIRQIQQAIIQ